MGNEQIAFIHPDRARFLKAKLEGRLDSEKKESHKKLAAITTYSITIEEKKYSAQVSLTAIVADAIVTQYLLSLVEHIKIIDYTLLDAVPITHLQLKKSVENLLIRSDLKYIGDIIRVINTEGGEKTFLSLPSFWLDSLSELIRELINYGVSTAKFAHSFDWYLLNALGKEAMLATGFTAENIKRIEKYPKPVKPK